MKILAWSALALAVPAALAIVQEEPASDLAGWTAEFTVEPGELVSTGRNPFFVLEPGYELEYVGGGDRLVIRVLDAVRVIDGVETRVVEEREWEHGELLEVSRNYFALSSRTNSVFYFGEEVDDYEDGKITGHGGAWLSGAGGARFGLMMPGMPLVKGRYYQEIAPGQALDRAEILALDGSVETPAGRFERCLVTEETNPLKPQEREKKVYAPGVGLLFDGDMMLVRYGKE
jgi:hypothetical protein